MLQPVQTAVPIPYDAVHAFCKAHHVQRLWLFGSILRDDFRPDSDIDILIEFEPGFIPGWGIVSLQAELSALLGRRVEFSMPAALGEHIRPFIMQTAQMIYEQS